MPLAMPLQYKSPVSAQAFNLKLCKRNIRHHVILPAVDGLFYLFLPHFTAFVRAFLVPQEREQEGLQ